MKTLPELAMQYAMIAPTGYDSGTFTGDQLEIAQAHLHEEMCRRFHTYDVQEAIKSAQDTLKIFAFHQTHGDTNDPDLSARPH